MIYKILILIFATLYVVSAQSPTMQEEVKTFIFDKTVLACKLSNFFQEIEKLEVMTNTTCNENDCKSKIFRISGEKVRLKKQYWSSFLKNRGLIELELHTFYFYFLYKNFFVKPLKFFLIYICKLIKLFQQNEIFSVKLP